MIETSSNATAPDVAAKTVNEESPAESTNAPRETGSESMPQQKATRGRMGKLKGVRVAGTGSYVPERIVTNEDLAALGCDSDWIVRRTGIRQRRHAEREQATSDLCYEAALRCLENAEVSIDEIDLILVATITPDHPTPSTACHLQRRLGAVAPAMDVGAACAGFMYALVTGAQFVSNGNARNVLVIGADLMSRTVDPEDKKTYPLFGDAAGAALLVPANADGCQSSDGESDSSDSGSQTDGLLAYQLGSEGCGGEMLCIPAGGSRTPIASGTDPAASRYLQMDGRGVFKWAVRIFDESAKDVLNAANVSSDQLGLVVLHQANQRIIDSAVSDLNVSPEKVFVNLDKYGNTSGASIPLALDEAAREGRLKEGDLLLLCGFGAGLAWGTALLRW
jgi:3-oxoacyl-[acyl-carrier-protein] synthase-3